MSVFDLEKIKEELSVYDPLMPCVMKALRVIGRLCEEGQKLEKQRDWLVNELCVGTQCDFPSQIECKYRTEKGYYCPERKEKFRCWVAHAEQAAKRMVKS